jgi:N-formylglutamate amidohydrolase
MNEKLPIIATAHHASGYFGFGLDEKCALTDRQKVMLTDIGTDQTVPRDGIHDPLISVFSRGMIDLNRGPKSPNLFRTHDFEGNNIWKDGGIPAKEDQDWIRKYIYDPFHGRLQRIVRSFTRPGLVMAWDNTGPHEIQNPLTGEKDQMPPFILSNRGTRDSTAITDYTEYSKRLGTHQNGNVTTCDPRFLAEFRLDLIQELKKIGLPDEVHLNRVYKGGYIAEYYNTRRQPHLNDSQPVQSLQSEYNWGLTHDEETLTPKPDVIEKIRTAYERALKKTYANLLTHTI